MSDILARAAFEAWCNIPADYHDRQAHLDKAWAACSEHTKESWNRVAVALTALGPPAKAKSPYPSLLKQMTKIGE